MQKTGIRILSYHLRNISGLSNMSTYDALKTAYTQFKDKMIDLLWHLAYFLRSVTRKAKFYVWCISCWVQREGKFHAPTNKSFRS